MSDLKRIVNATALVMDAAGYQANACILATRLVLNAARTLKLPGRGYPLVVRAQAMNAEMVGWLVEHRAMPASLDEVRDAHDHGARFVAVMAPEDEGAGFGGHLIGVWENGPYITCFDATAVQFDRPLKGIHVPRTLVSTRVPVAFVTGAQPATRKLDDGGMMVWEAEPRRRDFTNAPDWWQKFTTVQRLTRQIVAEVKSTTPTTVPLRVGEATRVRPINPHEE